MTDSDHVRMIANDPRVSDPKSVEMHTNAMLFVQDSEALGQRASAGQFVLLVHGIELALKGYLHQRGHTLEDLRDIGHKLRKLLDLCKAEGLVLSEPSTDHVIARFDAALDKAKLRYEFGFELPLFADARQVARGILQDTRPTLPATS
jgi:hypothetical protein